MNKKIRLAIFIFFVVAFVLLAIYTLFYSQGYRFDPVKKSFLKTGSISIRIKNAPAKIYLDGKFQKQFSSFSNNYLVKNLFPPFLITNLLPKKYMLEVKKPNYFTWKKIVKVKENKVSEFSNVLLVKRTNQLLILANKISNCLVSRDNQELLCEEFTTSSKSDQAVNLNQNNPNQKLEIVSPGTSNQITSLGFQKTSKLKNLLPIKWNKNQKEIIFSLVSKKSPTEFLGDYKSGKISLKPLNFLKDGYRNIEFFPTEDKLFYLQNNTLFSVFLGQKVFKPSPLLNNLATFQIQGDKIIVLTNSGFLLNIDSNGKIKEAFNLKPISIKPTQNYTFWANKLGVFLKTNQTLYYLTQKGNFKELIKPVREIILSPDGSKMAILNKNEIFIYNQGQSYFLNRFSGEIKQCHWLNNDYLVLNIAGEIKITEIDPTASLNIFPLKTPLVSKLLLVEKLQSDGRIYFIGKNALMLLSNFL